MRRERKAKRRTRSTLVSRQSGPTTISHPFSFSTTLSLPLNGCNHYVTHSSSDPSRLFSRPLSSRYSTPPLSRSCYRFHPLLLTPSHHRLTSSFFPSHPLSFYEERKKETARGLVRLLLHDVYYLILWPSFFLSLRHFSAKPSVVLPSCFSSFFFCFFCFHHLTTSSLFFFSCIVISVPIVILHRLTPLPPTVSRDYPPNSLSTGIIIPLA